jgi:hypothetical protein
MRKCCTGNYNCSHDIRFITGNEENPALVLSNVHKRTSAPDCASFGSIGLSMYTTFLKYTLPISPLPLYVLCGCCGKRWRLGRRDKEISQHEN